MEKQFLKNLGENLKQHRNFCNLTLKDVSENVDISPSNLSMIESGTRRLSIFNLIQLADLYNVKVSELLDNG